MPFVLLSTFYCSRREAFFIQLFLVYFRLNAFRRVVYLQSFGYSQTLR